VNISISDISKCVQFGVGYTSEVPTDLNAHNSNHYKIVTTHKTSHCITPYGEIAGVGGMVRRSAPRPIYA